MVAVYEASLSYNLTAAIAAVMSKCNGKTPNVRLKA